MILTCLGVEFPSSEGALVKPVVDMLIAFAHSKLPPETHFEVVSSIPENFGRRYRFACFYGEKEYEDHQGTPKYIPEKGVYLWYSGATL